MLRDCVVDVAEARNVDAVRPLPFVEAVVEVVGHAVGAHPEVVVHQVVAELAAVVAEAVGEPLGDRVLQDERRRDRRRAEEDDAGEVLGRLLGLGVDDAHAGGAPGLRIVDDLGDDRERAERQPLRRVGGRQGRRVAAEVGAERTAADAAVAVLAVAAAVVRLGQVGDPPDGHRAAAERLRDPALDLLFQAVHRHRRQVDAVGQLRQPVARAADAGEALDVLVPGRDVRVADRPVDAEAVLGVGLEVEVAPAVRLAAPEQRTAADVVAAHPVEALHLGVRVLLVVDEPMGRRRMRGVAGPALLLLLRAVLAGQPVAAGELPALQHRRRIVGMLHVAAALEHERPQALLGQFLRGPAAADPRPHHDGVVGVRSRSGALDEHVVSGYRPQSPGVQIRDGPAPVSVSISSFSRLTNAAGSSICPPSASVA